MRLVEQLVELVVARVMVHEVVQGVGGNQDLEAFALKSDKVSLSKARCALNGFVEESWVTRFSTKNFKRTRFDNMHSNDFGLRVRDVMRLVEQLNELVVPPCRQRWHRERMGRVWPRDL